MTLPVSYNPQSDYLYTIYEPYKYSLVTLRIIYQAIERINYIKSECNLEQGSANYLEALVLSGLLVTANNSLVASLIPNLLGEALRLSSEDAIDFVKGVIEKELSPSEIVVHFQRSQLLSLYALKDPQLSLLSGLSTSNLVIIAEFSRAMLSDMHQIINAYCESQKSLSLFLVYEDREIEFFEIQGLLGSSDPRIALNEIKTFNLLEPFDKISNSEKLINLLLIPKSFAESRYNPLAVYYDALAQRNINVSSSVDLIPIGNDITVRTDFVKKILVTDTLRVNLPAMLTAHFLQTNSELEVHIFSAKLDQYLLELSQLEFSFPLRLEIDSKCLTGLSSNLLLQYVISKQTNLQINYNLESSTNKQMSACTINCQVDNQTLSYFDKQKEYLSAPGQGFTIVTWGQAVPETLEILESADLLDPEVIVLQQLWPLPISAIASSVKNTARLLLVPDERLAFPMIDIYCNQLSRNLYQLLDAPIKVMSTEELKRSNSNLDQLFYEN